MSSKPDFIRKKFGPLRAKTLRNALAQRIVKEFPASVDLASVSYVPI